MALLQFFKLVYTLLQFTSISNFCIVTIHIKIEEKSLSFFNITFIRLPLELNYCIPKKIA